MRSYKEGRYLIFELSEGRDVRYDLSDGSYIGLSGKKVKNLCEQLRGYNVYDIIKSFEDEKYKRFLKRVYNHINTGVINTGTFLNYVRKYRNLEQYYSCGIENVDSNVVHISEVPDGLLNFIKENTDVILNRKLIESYKKSPNELNKVFNYKFKAIPKHEMIAMLTTGYHSRECFYKLVTYYYYDFERLIKYLDDLAYYEGITNFRNLVEELRDYARMSKQISKDGKFNKYPNNYLTTHTITVRNYNRLNRSFDENAFIEVIDTNLEFAYGDYVFIYPKSTNDIKLEAVSLTHCVASYINEVISGKCHIIFLRHKDNKDESLVTLQVVDNEVVHAKGAYNRDVNKSESEAIEAYNEYLSKFK